MRLCHLIHELGPGGAEPVLVYPARVALEARLEMQVPSLLPRGPHRYPQVLRDLGVRVGLVDLASRWNPRGRRRALRLLRADPPTFSTPTSSPPTWWPPAPPSASGCRWFLPSD